MRVLFLCAAFFLTTSACHPAEPDPSVNNLAAEAERFQQEALDLTVVDQNEYIGFFRQSDGATFSVIANYERRGSGRVVENITLQIPGRIPQNEPYIRGRWQDGVLIQSQLCEQVNGTERCQALRDAHRFPTERDGGEEVLQYFFQSVQPALRQQFESRGATPPSESPPSGHANSVT